MSSNKINSDPITEDFVLEVGHNTKKLKTLISSLEESLEQLKEKTYVPPESTAEWVNVYYFDPSIREEFIGVAKAGMSSTLDTIIEMYTDWLIRVATMVEINGRHYHNSKILRNQLDEIMSMLIPNAKNATKKADEFIAKAQAFIDYQKKQTALKKESRDSINSYFERD